MLDVEPFAYEIDALEIDREDDLLKGLKKIDEIVKSVLESSGQLFTVIRERNKVKLKLSRLGKRLIEVMNVGEMEFSHHFPMHDVSPYAELLFRCAARCEDPYIQFKIYDLFPSEYSWGVSVLNNLVCDLREEARVCDLKGTIRKFDKASNKRRKSLIQYIDALFVNCSRLVVIRVDLSYRPRAFDGLELWEAVSKAKSDWSRMQKDLYKGKPVGGMRGFACKLEYGHLKGFHFHLLVFYDGSRYCKDVVIARLIGVHWSEVIAQGDGLYYNCNKRKSNYRRLGIGVLSHNDVELIGNLKFNVSEYLVKVDYFVRLLPECGRVFFRGNMPKSKPPGVGRPREALKSSGSV